MKTNASAKKETRTGEFVCTGHVVLEGDRMGIAFRLLNADGTFAEQQDRIYAAKNFRGVNSGRVYAIPYTEGKIIPDERKFVRAWPDGPQATAWEARSAATQGELAAISAEKKLGGLHHIRGLLGPLRRQYQASGTNGRIAIELMVLRALRWGD